MENTIIEIDDEERGKGRKIYLTSWGTSVWRIHALVLTKKDASKKLSDYLKANAGTTGRLIKNND